MNSESRGSYRKNLITNGLCYINGEEREVLVSNMSMTGMLVQLTGEDIYLSDIENGFSNSLISRIIDFYLPQLRVAGSAEVVRGDKGDDHISLALKFKEVTYDADNLLYKRKVYRKNMSVLGQILLNNQYHYFQSINVSVEGLMVRLEEKIAVAEGLITSFEFKKSNLKGEVKVIWVDIDSDGKTLLGLQYINMSAHPIKGIPRFYIETD